MHSNGSPLLVAQRSNSTTDQLTRPPFRKPDAGPPPRSAVGFLLLDGSLRPIVFNAEALRVLSYPDPPANVRRPDVFLAGKIREPLQKGQCTVRGRSGAWRALDLTDRRSLSNGNSCCRFRRCTRSVSTSSSKWSRRINQHFRRPLAILVSDSDAAA